MFVHNYKFNFEANLNILCTRSGYAITLKGRKKNFAATNIMPDIAARHAAQAANNNQEKTPLKYRSTTRCSAVKTRETDGKKSMGTGVEGDTNSNTYSHLVLQLLI